MRTKQDTTVVLRGSTCKPSRKNIFHVISFRIISTCKTLQLLSFDRSEYLVQHCLSRHSPIRSSSLDGKLCRFQDTPSNEILSSLRPFLCRSELYCLRIASSKPRDLQLKSYYSSATLLRTEVPPLHFSSRSELATFPPGG